MFSVIRRQFLGKEKVRKNTSLEGKKPVYSRLAKHFVSLNRLTETFLGERVSFSFTV